MASTFMGTGIFNSGPHRFAERARGSLVVPLLALGGSAAGSVALGALEVEVIVTGRLVGATDAALWHQRGLVEAKLSYPPQVGDLVDHWGRVWTGMSFVRFEVADRVDRGRVVSVGYTARFVRFL